MKSIIIIGAGISGLACAEHLQKTLAAQNIAYQITILEGRSTVGGRIANQTIGPYQLDLGAAWLHGDINNPITPRLRQDNALILSDEENTLFYHRKGERLSSAEEVLIEELFEDFYQALCLYQTTSHKDCSIYAFYEQFCQNQSLNKKQSALLKHALYKFFTLEYAGDLSQLSALSFDKDDQCWGANYVPRDGFYTLIKSIQNTLINCEILCNQVVSQVSILANRIEVKTEDTSLQADYVVSTLPLGVLKKQAVQFNPPLSTEKIASIQRLGIGHLCKVFLVFDTVFWNESAEYIEVVDSKFPLQFHNLYAHSKKPILCALIGGKLAQKLQQEDDTAITDKIYAYLKKLYPKQFSPAKQYHITRWSNDPYSYGSYSFVAIDADHNDYQVLAQPHFNRVFFAGEHTCTRFPSTVQGAFLSGIRAANDLLKELD